MSKPDIEGLLGAFPRNVPVFPLPNAVLFPGAILPLHIFEPRYQQMVADVLATGDRVMAMALLKQCSPEEYEQRPPFHETICLGQIIHHEALPGGRSNIALLGLSAAHAVPVDGREPYRTAEAAVLVDVEDTRPDDERILEAISGKAIPHSDLATLREQLGRILAAEKIPAALVNTCAQAAPVFPAHKQELLEERSVTRRLARLVELLERPWQWN